MTDKLVFGNWKMNGDLQSSSELVKTLIQELPPVNDSQVVIFPPSIFIPHISELLKQQKVLLGAQNVFPKNSGAFTGETSVTMFKEFDCKYVLVGHSERRHIFKEDEKFIAQKFHHVKEHDMIPVLCVGESLEQYEKGLTEEVLANQICSVCDLNKDFSRTIIAYEPVWAIGTGKTATPEQAQKIHEFIKGLISDLDKNALQQPPVLYGGSVNENNSKALFSMNDIDGVLVGGASLNAKQFVEIVKCIN